MGASSLVQEDTQTRSFSLLVSSLALTLLGTAADLGPLASRLQKKGSEGPLCQSPTLKHTSLWVEMGAPGPNTLSVAATTSPAYRLTGASKAALREASGSSGFMG